MRRVRTASPDVVHLSDTLLSQVPLVFCPGLPIRNQYAHLAVTLANSVLKARRCRRRIGEFLSLYTANAICFSAVKTRRFTVKAHLIALAILTSGAALSMKLDDWSWFSRAGALLVINGIILTSRQIIDHIQRLKLHQIPPQRHSKRDWASNDKYHLIHDDEKLWQSEKHGLYMLITGTFVWGFGDLLNLL